ncbi:hypothetical protein [Streptomyces celluloflavus]|uniref:hypothetical protein n=1 Tax=Streptomyces celluloflavus TaxID=58344 RepID=UPI0036A5041A
MALCEDCAEPAMVRALRKVSGAVAAERRMLATLPEAAARHAASHPDRRRGEADYLAAARKVALDLLLERLEYVLDDVGLEEGGR